MLVYVLLSWQTQLLQESTEDAKMDLFHDTTDEGEASFRVHIHCNSAFCVRLHLDM